MTNVPVPRGQQPDYFAERIAHAWPTTLEEAEAVMAVFNPPKFDDVCLLAVDLRERPKADELINGLGDLTGANLAGVELVNEYTTQKGKKFLDYKHTADDFVVFERRIILPEEKIAVVSLFKAMSEQCFGAYRPSLEQ